MAQWAVVAARGSMVCPMRRFATTYRWEFFLLFGLPVVSGLLRMAGFEAVLRLAIWFDFDCGRVSCLAWVSHGITLLIVTALAATYPFVRRQGCEFLTLLWGLEIAIRCAALVVYGVEIATGSGEFPLGFRLIEVPFTITEWGSSVSTSSSISYDAINALQLVVYLWFIRRASRISMSHAFLLFGVSMADAAFTFSIDSVSLLYIIAYPTLPYIGTTVFYLLAQVGLNALAFRALIRRDALSPASRMVMAGVLTVAALLVDLLGWSLWWGIMVSPIVFGTGHGSLGFSSGSTAVQALRSVTYVLPVLALGYFVRVRRSVDIERELDTTDVHQ